MLEQWGRGFEVWMSVCVYVVLYVGSGLARNTDSVFENKVLRRIFGPKRDEMTGDWRKLHNEEAS
jgi:hypothetical protein